MTRRVYNPNCKTCQYRSGMQNINGCDYLLITGKPRGCPVKGCKRFVEGERIKLQEGIYVEKVTEEDIIMANYVSESKARAGVLRDPLQHPVTQKKR